MPRATPELEEKLQRRRQIIDGAADAPENESASRPQKGQILASSLPSRDWDALKSTESPLASPSHHKRLWSEEHQKHVARQRGSSGLIDIQKGDDATENNSASHKAHPSSEVTCWDQLTWWKNEQRKKADRMAKEESASDGISAEACSGSGDAPALAHGTSVGERQNGSSRSGILCPLGIFCACVAVGLALTWQSSENAAKLSVNSTHSSSIGERQAPISQPAPEMSDLSLHVASYSSKSRDAEHKGIGQADDAVSLTGPSGAGMNGTNAAVAGDAPGHHQNAANRNGLQETSNQEFKVEHVKPQLNISDGKTPPVVEHADAPKFPHGGLDDGSKLMSKAAEDREQFSAVIFGDVEVNVHQSALSYDRATSGDVSTEYIELLEEYPLKQVYRIGHVQFSSIGQVEQGQNMLSANVLVVNNGAKPWPAETRLAAVFGESYGLESLSLGADVYPGSYAELMLRFYVPRGPSAHASSRLETSMWLLEAEGQRFGPLLVLEVLWP